MSFPIAAGVLLPDDFKTIQRVFSEITDEPWFTACPDRREQFALTVIDAYRLGITDSDELAAHCREIAFQRFGNAAIQLRANSKSAAR